MLSILIPAYNHNIVSLVNALHRQATDALADFEIIVMEDGSTQFLDENKAVANLPFCTHTVLSENIGRAGIRNRLADAATHNTLLFIDCDAKINSTHFVEKYLPFCAETCVVIGGTAYDPKNQNPDYSLRLKYGREREAQSAAEREKAGRYTHFATFNFLISKSIFQQIRFDESIRGYGHEDTLFGHQIAEGKYTVYHIDNPLVHSGLDDNRTFLKKTETAVRNLYALHKTGKYPFLDNQSKLLRTFARMEQKKRTPRLAALFSLIQPIAARQLTGKKPSLFVYDLYKLLYLAQISTEK